MAELHRPHAEVQKHPELVSPVVLAGDVVEHHHEPSGDGHARRRTQRLPAEADRCVIGAGAHGQRDRDVAAVPGRTVTNHACLLGAVARFAPAMVAPLTSSRLPLTVT